LTAGAHSYAGAEAINISYLRWLLENAGLSATTRALFEMLRSNSRFFQLLQYVVGPIRVVLELSILLLLFGIALVWQLLSRYFGIAGL
jgi:hypothetical protein